jgi:hypothetical protein
MEECEFLQISQKFKVLLIFDASDMVGIYTMIILNKNQKLCKLFGSISMPTVSRSRPPIKEIKTKHPPILLHGILQP